jgi:hypothetical protein
MSVGERRDPLCIIKEGFLEHTKLNKLSQLVSKGKKDALFLKWGTYYWILRETLLLEGYKTTSKSSKDLVKTINLNHCENISVCDFTGKKQFAFRLSVYSKGRMKEYLFNAKSERERDLWVSSIVSVCDLDPDDDTYEWLDVNFTPNDRLQQEKKKKHGKQENDLHPPPLPPRSMKDGPHFPAMAPFESFHSSMLSLDETRLSSAMVRPPLPVPKKSFGSSDNLSRSFGDKSGYGFIKTMPHGVSSKQFNSTYGEINDSESSDDDYVESQDSLYDDNIFGDVTYPGKGGKSEISELVSNDPNVVKASFSKPSRSKLDPGDRPRQPLPYEVSARSPVPMRKELPPVPPPTTAKPTKPTAQYPLPPRNMARERDQPTLRGDESPKAFPITPSRHNAKLSSPPLGSGNVSSELQHALDKRQTTRPSVPSKKANNPPPEPPPASRKKALVPPPLKPALSKESSQEETDHQPTPSTARNGYINSRDQSWVETSVETSRQKPRSSSSSTRNDSSSSTGSETPHYPFEFTTLTPPSPAPSFPLPYEESASSGSSDTVASKRSTLSGKALFSTSPGTKRRTKPAEPLYVNWPLSEELKRELELEMEPASSSEPPVPSRANRSTRQPSFREEKAVKDETNWTDSKSTEQKGAPLRSNHAVKQQGRSGDGASPKRNGRPLPAIQENVSKPSFPQAGSPLPKTNATDKPPSSPKPTPPNKPPPGKPPPKTSAKPSTAVAQKDIPHSYLHHSSPSQQSPNMPARRVSSQIPQDSPNSQKSAFADKLAMFNAAMS